MESYIDLPWQTQLVGVSGYFGYVIAYSGRREGHQTFDTAAISLCFGSVCLFVLSTEAFFKGCWPNLPKQVVPILSVVASVFAGALWRAFLRHFTHDLLKKISRSDDDGLLSAWGTVIQNQTVSYTQLIVTLNDGRVLESYPLGDFSSWPNGPCTLGNDGSIAMYVTHIEENGAGRQTNGINDEDGMRITFIPVNQIKEVDFKRKKKA